MAKISYADHVKKSDISVILAEIVFRHLKSEYKTVQLSQVIDTSSGGTPSRTNSQFYGGEIPWLKSGELNDSVITKAEEFITEEGLQNSSAKIFPQGTLLVAMYGATAGKTGILNMDAATNQAVCSVIPKDTTIDTNFLFWFFRAHRFYFIDISRGGAQPNISQGVINKTLFPIVPKEVQTEIAVFLSRAEKTKHIDYSLIPKDLHHDVKSTFNYLHSLESLVVENKAQKTYLAKLRQSILQEAIEGKLTVDWRAENPVCLGDPNTDAAALLAAIQTEKQTLIAQGKLKKEKPLPPISNNEMPFALPEGWRWVRLGMICTKVTDGFHNTPKKLANGIIYVSATHIREQGVNWQDCLYVSPKDHAELHKKTYPCKGEILITNRGAGCGTPAIIDIDEQFGFQNAALIGFNQALISNRYVFNFIVLMRDQILADFVSGGLQPMLSNTTLSTIPIPLPPLAEQHEIVERVDRLLASVSALEQQVTERQQYAEQLMQAVLKAAFAG